MSTSHARSRFVHLLVALVVLLCICASVAWAYTTGSTGSLTRSSNGEEWSAVAAIDYVSWDLSSGTETYYDWSDGYTSGESVRVSLTALSSYVDADVYWRAVVVYDPPGTNFGIYATSPQESMEFGPIDPTNGSGNEKSYNAPVDKETFVGNSDKLVRLKLPTGSSPGTLGDPAWYTLERNVLCLRIGGRNRPRNYVRVACSTPLSLRGDRQP